MPPNISKETTHFTEPIRVDGTIDYLAAMNSRLSEGVTPENNAFTGIAKVMPDDLWGSEEHRRFVFNQLGIDSPKEAPRFVPFEDFVNQRGFSLHGGSPPNTSQFIERLNNALTRRDMSPEEIETWVEKHGETSNADQPAPPTQPSELAGQPWRKKNHQLIAAWLRRNKPALKRIAAAVRKTTGTPRGGHPNGRKCSVP